MTSPPVPPSLDLTRPLRGVDDLESLVAYVYGANPNNETDWLEWKAGLDLTGAKGRFHAGRHILGFANRAPSTARRRAGGLAFLILGAEPGNAPGQPPMDPADLTSGIRTYVGTQGPVWAPLWVTFQGVQVLVVTVEAPQPGDSIHTLQKTFEGSEEGTIFVRHPGTTARASSSDVRMLSERLALEKDRVEIEVSTRREPICVLDTTDRAVEAWIADERAWLLGPLQKTQMERMVDDQRSRLDGVMGLGRFSALSAGVGSIAGSVLGRVVAEDRTEEAYLAEVEAYLEAARPKLVGAATRGLLAETCCRFAVLAGNPTDGNVPAVALEVTFDDEVILDVDENGLEVMPERARLWGPRKVGGLDLEALSHSSSRPSHPSDCRRNRHSRVTIGSSARRSSFLWAIFGPPVVMRAAVLHCS